MIGIAMTVLFFGSWVLFAILCFRVWRLSAIIAVGGGFIVSLLVVVSVAIITQAPTDSGTDVATAETPQDTPSISDEIAAEEKEQQQKKVETQQEPVKKPRKLSPQEQKAVTGSYADCLLAQAKTDKYTSFDGGQSAVKMMMECKKQWYDYVDMCMGNNRTDGSCTVDAGLLAQGALKITNR